MRRVVAGGGGEAAKAQGSQLEVGANVTKRNWQSLTGVEAAQPNSLKGT